MTDSRGTQVGPHPSFIQVAKPYVFEQKIQDRVAALGVSGVKEDTVRLAGIGWIDNVRKALQLPVRTFNTAAVYYHKFRLVHPESEYSYADAAAAALFTACKIEDTLKKSKEILCAAWNLRHGPSDQLTPDDSQFESHSRSIIGLERLMLEASGFDFRNRQPQKLVIKLAKVYDVDRDVGRTAYQMALDIYRTFAPLKQTTPTMAMACLELSLRLHGHDITKLKPRTPIQASEWRLTRSENMETLMDLLDLYNSHRQSTVVGQSHTLDSFISIRILLNNEQASKHYPRFTNWHEKKSFTNGRVHHTPPNHRDSPRSLKSSSTASPLSPSGTRRVGERGREGTVRFMLDARRALDEKDTVRQYFTVEEEEYVEEVKIEERRN